MMAVARDIQQRLTWRIDELLARRMPPNSEDTLYAMITERFCGTLTLIGMTYGADSIQAKLVSESMERCRQADETPVYGDMHKVWSTTEGVLQSLRSELQTGLVSTIALRAAGESIGDFLALAKQALEDEREQARNVAAVLAAAAFEDAVRRMGSSLAEVQGRPDLKDVLTALKQKQVLAGPSVTTAQGYLKFRNDALHADWKSIDRAVIGSCLAFTEGLVATHFA
jgi:hypothetical protein